jgi:predicted PurR-regulated permease PerM
VAQGLLATFGYWITGSPEPVFFGIATALASLVPGIGTLLVWVPLGVFMIVTGHVGRGFAELLWGTFVVIGFSDYVLRPRLLGGDHEMPTLVTFVALFGGVEVFGLKGLVVGPIVMSIAVATLRLYGREAEARRHT